MYVHIFALIKPQVHISSGAAVWMSKEQKFGTQKIPMSDLTPALQQDVVHGGSTQFCSRSMKQFMPLLRIHTFHVPGARFFLSLLPCYRYGTVLLFFYTSRSASAQTTRIQKGKYNFFCNLEIRSRSLTLA